MNEEELRKIAKEEMAKSIMDNLDSALIFTYIKNLEEENRQLKFDYNQAEELKHFFMNEKDKLEKENEKLNIENINLKRSQIIDKSSIPNQDNFYDYYNYISKDKILKILNEDNDLSEEQILYSIEVLWKESNRLEDIEDWCATQCISKNKIKDKIKELEDIRETLTDSNGMLEISASIDALKEVLGEEKDD